MPATIADKDLIDRAKGVLNPKRYSPMFDAGGVGCALVTDGGAIYVGVCIDAACGIGFCAEHTAVASMITAGEWRIATIVAVDWDGGILSPCGRCRELIGQICPENMDTRVLLRCDDPSAPQRAKTMRELLPEHWTWDR